MAKKIPDDVCRANYEKVVQLFKQVVPDSGRFVVVYGCGVDVGMMSYVVVRTTTYTYASYAIGFDQNANEIVVLPIDTDIQTHGSPIYLKNSEIGGAKRSWLSKEITIKDKRLPKKYIQLNVQEKINEDPDNVVIPVLQEDEARLFSDFFKNQYTK